MDNTSELIINTIKTVADAVPNTINGIAKIKEIQRTTGISARQSKRLLRESETNEQLALAFQKFCDANPGYYYKQTIGNIEMSNLGKILEYAKMEFQADETIPNENLDEEWLLKFLNTAGQVSEEEKQRILGKVLAGQLKKPDSISYRTLTILQTLTKKELLLFKKALSCAFYLPNIFALLLKKGNEAMLSVNDIMYLDECNLIDGSTSKVFSVTNGSYLFSCNNKYLLIVKQQSCNTIESGCYFFTNAALELLPFIKIEEAPLEEIKTFVSQCKNNGPAYSLHEVVSINGNNVQYFTKDLLD